MPAGARLRRNGHSRAHCPPCGVLAHQRRARRHRMAARPESRLASSHRSNAWPAPRINHTRNTPDPPLGFQKSATRAREAMCHCICSICVASPEWGNAPMRTAALNATALLSSSCVGSRPALCTCAQPTKREAIAARASQSDCRAHLCSPLGRGSFIVDRGSR